MSDPLISDEVWARASWRVDLAERGLDVVPGEVLEVHDELTGEPVPGERIVVGFDGSTSTDHVVVVSTLDGHLYRIDTRALDFHYPATPS